MRCDGGFCELSSAEQKQKILVALQSSAINEMSCFIVNVTCEVPTALGDHTDGIFVFRQSGKILESTNCKIKMVNLLHRAPTTGTYSR